jgi:branched-chain amino acid transport system permease protein
MSAMSERLNGPEQARLGWLAVAAAPVLLAAAGLAVPALVPSQLLLSLMTQTVINAVLATAVGFAMRQSRLTSFGHAAFFGLAAYIVAINADRGWVPMEAALLLAVLLPALAAFLLALSIVRLPHLAFSMMTLAVAQACYELFLRVREFGGGDDGMAVRMPARLFGVEAVVFQRPDTMFVICWALLMAILLGVLLLSRSHFGQLTFAIRENEERARYIGYETLLPRAAVFALSAGIAGVAGALFALYNGFVTPGTLHWSLSGEALVMAVIGGPSVIFGPALGAGVFLILKDVAGDLTEHWPAVIGGILIVVTVLLPQGIGGVVADAVRRVGRR